MPERLSEEEAESRRLEATAEGISNAGRGADPEWKLRALTAVVKTCHTMPEFTVNDVWARMAEQDQFDNTGAMGNIMVHASRSEHWCESTGLYEKCPANLSRVGNDMYKGHRPKFMVRWRSLLYGH